MKTCIRLVVLSAIMPFILSTEVLAQRPERISVLVQLAPGSARGPVRAFAGNQGGHVQYEYNILPNVINLRNIPITALNGLRRIPGVVSVLEDPVIQANLQDSTPLINGLQSQINSAGFSANGEGIRICVADTGIDSNHWMFQDWPDTTNTRIDYDAALNLIGTGFPEDDQGHGTHVAGIAAGREGLYFNNLPIQGIAPKATIIPVKVLDSAGTGDGSDLIAAFDHCTDPNLPNGPADVISLSLGYGAFPDQATCDAEPVVDAANAAVEAGAVVVAASGNEGNSNALAAPACGSNVISVGGTWDYTGIDLFYCGSATVDEVLCFSNKSNMLDVVAPGCSIHSGAADLLFNLPNGVIEMCGTSQAAPHVSGLAALLLHQNPELSPIDSVNGMPSIRDCIRDGAEDMGDVGFDSSYGYGRINVTNSLSLCLPNEPVNQPPEANFTYECDFLSCTFTSTSTDEDGWIDLYEWDFGDGATDSGETASHVYSSSGTYSVTLTVTDNDQADDTTTQNITVDSPGCNNDRICDPGEDCNNCPNDCRSKTTGKPDNRYCCSGDLPDCGNPRCSEDGWVCWEDVGFCNGNEDCDDGVFCNGEETCGVNGICQSGDDPCPGLVCNEEAKSCSNPCGGNKQPCNVDDDCCSGTCKDGTCRGN